MICKGCRLAKVTHIFCLSFYCHYCYLEAKVHFDVLLFLKYSLLWKIVYLQVNWFCMFNISCTSASGWCWGGSIWRKSEQMWFNFFSLPLKPSHIPSAQFPISVQWSVPSLANNKDVLRFTAVSRKRILNLLLEMKTLLCHFHIWRTRNSVIPCWDRKSVWNIKMALWWI